MLRFKNGLAILIFSLCFSLLFGCGKPSDSDGFTKVKVTGTVTDENHSPISGALVVPKPKGDVSGPIPEIARYTDHEGHFTWYVPAGSYEFLIDKEGYKPRQIPVQAQESEKPVHLTITLEKE